MRRRFIPWTLSVVLKGMLGSSCLLTAAEPQDGLVEVQRLRDAGSFAAAIDLLRRWIAERPEDGEAERLLAQTFYWNKDFSRARAVYEQALMRHPEDTELRLQYGRMLAETGDRARARLVVTPLLNSPSSRADASTLLGTIAYWDGDLEGAQRSFRMALDANPKQEEAHRQFNEIRTITAPWVRVGASATHDDQPITRVVSGIEAGWFATPLTQITARVQPTEYWLNNSTTEVSATEGVLSRYMPSLRFDLELAGGIIHRSRGGLWDWTGRAQGGVRLPAHFTFRVRSERSAYLSTRSSLNTAVMTRTQAGLLHWGETHGWSAEAAYQRSRFPDGNHVNAAYGWLLAPLVLRERVAVQSGYAVAANNADQSRFELKNSNQPFTPDDPRFQTAGQYIPYYTPDHLITHSVIAALKLAPTRRLIFRFGGSYAVQATDKEPFLYVSAGRVIRDFYKRDFTPWNAHAAFQFAVNEGFTLEPTAEVGRSSFYSWTTVGLQATYRLRQARENRAAVR